jgi:creatinine amidohydrolase/Fe(II)-dependent formamide hydrolase-like protein
VEVRQLLMGHYPWEQIAGDLLVGIQKQHPETLIIWGTEASMGRPEILLPGDHAAQEETSYGLALLPEFIDMEALHPGRDDSVWPNGLGVQIDQRYPGVNYDTNDPLFAQMGVDARQGSSERGEEGIEQLVDHVARKVNCFIAN